MPLRWLVSLVAVLSIACHAHAVDVTLTIDVAERHQVMEGFGASGAWWPAWVGDYPKEKQDQILDLLFTRQGIGLSIYRYNLPAGGGKEIRMPSRTTAQVETSPGVFDLSADRKALDLLRAVRKRGVERFVLFANSPPPRLTLSGMTSGGEAGESNLRPGAEGDFAEYLVALSTRIRDEYDLPDAAISPINEPQWKWGEKRRTQEGCHYTPSQAATVVAKLVEEVRRRKAGFRVEAPESGQWDKTAPYAKAMFASPLVDKFVTRIAIHSYWTDPAARRRAAEELRRDFPTKQFAMTEYCEMKPGHSVGIDSGLDLAEVIHDDLTVASVVSWQWWLAVAGGGYGDGLIYASPRTQTIETTKRLWVLGQFSRHVRPGYVRVAVGGSDDAPKATAFLSPDGGRLVCVVINSAAESVSVTPTAAGYARTAFYVTDATHDLAMSEGDGHELPARSVTTFLFDRTPGAPQTRP